MKPPSVEQEAWAILLRAAVQSQDEAQVAHLLLMGNDPNIPPGLSHRNRNILFDAMEANNVAVMRMLVENGARVARDEYGSDPLRQWLRNELTDPGAKPYRPDIGAWLVIAGADSDAVPAIVDRGVQMPTPNLFLSTRQWAAGQDGGTRMLDEVLARAQALHLERATAAAAHPTFRARL